MNFSVFGREELSFEIQILVSTAKNNKFKSQISTATINYRGVMEESGALRAQQHARRVWLPGVTGNTPAPTVVNKNGSALASDSVNVMGGQGTIPSPRQAMAATTSYFVYEGANIAQEYGERDAAVKVLQLHRVGDMQSTGSAVQGCLSHCLLVLQLI